MKEALTTNQFEYEKCSFLIDLVRHQTESLYIEITQNIDNRKIENRIIRLNPSVVSDLIRLLKMYMKEIPGPYMESRSYLSDAIQKKIQDRYLRGVPINEIAMQVDLSEKLVEMILRNRGIQIVSFKIPYFRKRRKRK